MLGSGLGEMYELERAERYLREHIAFAEAHELDTLVHARRGSPLVHVYRGRWDDGRGARRASLLAQRTRPDQPASRGLIALGRVRARRGDPGATSALDEALELARPGGHLQRLGHVHAARAEAAWLAGDRERGRRGGRPSYPLALEKRHLWFAGELAYWQWKAGALDEAPDWIAEPYRLQLDGRPGRRRRSAGASAAARTRRRARSPRPTTRRRCRGARASSTGSARPAARLAASGCARSASRCRAGRARRRARTRPSSTARELEVLRLVADGPAATREVAERLVLSPRTVDHHVSAVLRKLGARTRGEAAAPLTAERSVARGGEDGQSRRCRGAGRP